jgi:hypothetical protein
MEYAIRNICVKNLFSGDIFDFCKTVYSMTLRQDTGNWERHCR